MGTTRRSTTEVLASRSTWLVIACTLFFAMIPFALEMLVVTLSPDGIMHPQLSLAIWIPFCLLMIPVIRFMAREIQPPQKRVDTMDKSKLSTIELFASRSNFAVIAITLFFALMGVALDFLVSSRGNGNPQMFFAVWIPFCFLTIPPLHFMAREILALRQHVETLQTRVEATEQDERHEG